MRAAMFFDRGTVKVQEVDAPTSPAPGEVLIKPQMCGVCGTDLHEYTDGPIVVPTEPHPLNGSHAPQILGHEFSAVVVEVGDGVTELAPGDLCSVMPLIYCGTCYECQRGMHHLCRTMACTGLSSAWGGLADLAMVRASQLIKVPVGVSALQAALIEPTAVAAYGVDRSGMAGGDTALVTGAGPIGSLATLYALARGARRVVVSEMDPVRRQLAASLGEGLGEVVTLDPSSDDVVDVLRDLTGGVGADVAIECAGKEAALQLCIESVKPAGHVVQTALHVRPASISAEALAVKDLTLSGTWCYPVYDFPRIVALVASGRLPVERVVTSTIPLESVVEGAFDRLITRGAGDVKILIKVA